MNPYEQPPRGADPVDETLTPQVGTSVLIDSALQPIKPQIGTTVLGHQVFAKNEHPAAHTSILNDSVLPKMPPPRVSMLGESTLSSQKPQRQTSVLPNDLLQTIPPPKMPRLVSDKQQSDEQ